MQSAYSVIAGLLEELIIGMERDLVRLLPSLVHDERHPVQRKPPRGLALQIAQGQQWAAGELEAAGAIRAISDELRARGRADLADEILASSEKLHKPSGSASVALAGRRLPRAAGEKLTGSRVLRSRGIFEPEKDLRRLRVGNQASVLKVMDATNTKAAYMRGLDGVMWAPLYEQQRQAIFQALGISTADLDAVANTLMTGYPRCREKKECLALLGVIGSTPDNTIPDATRRRLLTFLVGEMQGSSDVVVRRQACLNLALLDAIDRRTIEAVICFYEKSDNVWETFPVQQFFEYHAGRIQRLPERAAYRQRLAAVDGLYTENILKFL